jgi:hypothetical protein
MLNSGAQIHENSTAVRSDNFLSIKPVLGRKDGRRKDGSNNRNSFRKHLQIIHNHPLVSSALLNNQRINRLNMSLSVALQALTNLGRLSSRHWQSFPTAPDGTGLTCGQHIESHSCIFSFSPFSTGKYMAAPTGKLRGHDHDHDDHHHIRIKCNHKD